MLHTITPSEMKTLEAAWMRDTGVPGCLLMAEAARGLTDALGRALPGLGRALFLCGPGNNGGDGYAAALFWAERGGTSLIWELQAETTPDAGVFRRMALQRGLPVRTLTEAPRELPGCGAVCDALFGTGLSRAPEGIAAALIRLVNASGLPVIAADIPSGLSGLDGSVPGEAVRAAETVTFHRPKQGLYLREGCAFTGRITVHPIHIPADWGGARGLRVMEAKDLKRLVPGRDPRAHKGDLGRIVILAGSAGMAGAAAICASACVRAGAGLTRVLCRPWIAPIVQTLAPEATCTLLPEVEGCLTGEAADAAREALRTADAAAVGPGLGQTEDLLPLLRAFAEAPCPVVWDADALNLLARHPELLPLPAAHVVTPHPGEAARLLGMPAAEITAAPLEALRALREKTGCRVLLKGARTLMAAGGEEAVNPNGTPALAKGGSGDALTGFLAALLARPGLGEDALLPLQLAAFRHAEAARRAAEELGEDAVTASGLARRFRVTD